MQVEPVTLQGRVVRLEPLQVADAAALAAVADPHTFDYFFMTPAALTADAFATYLTQLLATPAMCPFVVRWQETGQAIGVTTYMDIRPQHRGLEIGTTWYGQAYRGTAVNPESKYLLLRHAFEQLGAIRVQLKTDHRNVHSRRAILKLGAQQEAIFRKHFIMHDGYLRDNVMFSINDNDWPRVKANLEARLGYAP
jgi:RimJ/RimL family protein N-acetyltransferase